MKKELKRDYVQELIHDIQKARSIFYENNGSDTDHEKEIADSIGEMSEPWLFGKQCLLLTLVKVVDTEIDDSLIMNLSAIAQHSQMLRILSVGSKRHDPTIEEIFNVESDIELLEGLEG